jgi:hypothetical protein
MSGATAVRVDLPEEATGPALAAAVRRIRLTLARGDDVVVDPARAASWPPGPRLVLDGLRDAARRRGRSWEERPMP